MAKAANTLRIGNAQGFWGDSIDAPARLAAQAPDLDVLTLDYLATNALESELIVVNDGSTDETGTNARGVLRQPKIKARLLENFPNRGKGAAVCKGLLAAQKPIGLFFDADLSTPLEEIPKVIEPVAKGDVDIAFGSRALNRSLIGLQNAEAGVISKLSLPWGSSVLAVAQKPK